MHSSASHMAMAGAESLAATLWPLDGRLGGLLFVALLASGAAVLWLNATSRSAPHAQRVDPAHRRRRGAPEPNPIPTPRVRAALDMLSEFDAWLTEASQAPDVMSSFDAFTRELLARTLGASHVRCYRRAGTPTRFMPLSVKGRASTPDPQANTWIEQVAASGRAFLRAPELTPDHAAVITPPALAMNLRVHGKTIGVILLGSATPSPAAEHLESTSALLALFWSHVEAISERASATRVDASTGALNRSDFFHEANNAIAEASRGGGAVAAAVLTIEGLRSLDDNGHWRERDELLSEIGKRLRSGLRERDLLGRFADDRYVMLLSGADLCLARVIAGKLITAVRNLGATAAPRIVARVGLSAGRLPGAEFPDLLKGAFGAARDARRAGAPLSARALPEAAR